MNQTTTPNYPNMNEWTLQELAFLEESLKRGWNEGTDIPAAFADEPNLAAWYEYYLGTIDEILNAAGIHMRDSRAIHDGQGRQLPTYRVRDFDKLAELEPVAS